MGSEGEVEISQPHNLSGLKGLEVCDVKFNNCKVPREAVLGCAGSGLSLLQSVLHQHKYMQAAGLITTLTTLLDDTIQHTKNRQQFKLPLSDFPLVRQKLGKMAGRLYCLESMVYFTAGLAGVLQHQQVLHWNFRTDAFSEPGA